MENDNVDEKMDACMELTTHQKYIALSALGKVRITTAYRDIDTMCADIESWEIGGDGSLSKEFGHGTTQYRAVDALWEIVTNLPENKFLVTGPGTDKRREVRWNGFMWEDIPREE